MWALHNRVKEFWPDLERRSFKQTQNRNRQWVNFKFNIGIIGGGIGGVAAAVALHRAGIDATVYERANELREVGAGMMLWPNATRVLKELGLLERVAALSGPNQHFLVRSSTGTILMDIGLGHFDVPALCTRRSDLLDALISALPADRVRLGHDFGYFERQKSSVGIHFSNGVSVEHDFLIGADGIRSRVRSQLLGVHETNLPRLHGLAGAGASYRRLFRTVRTAKPGDEENASVFSTPAATGSPGMLQRIPILITSTRPKGVSTSFCRCSRVGTSRSKA